MDAALTLVCIGLILVSIRTVFRFFSQVSVLHPQIQFLEAEVVRIADLANDEHISVVCREERIAVLREDLGALERHLDRLQDRLRTEQDRSRQLVTARQQEAGFRQRLFVA